jgi:hypothetical protein
MNEIDLTNNFLLRPKVFLVIDEETGKAVAMHYSRANAAAAARWRRLKSFRIEER